MGAYKVATTPGQSGPGNDGNKGVLDIPQSSSITEASTDCLESYQDTCWGEYNPSAEMQLVAFPADCANSSGLVDWLVHKFDNQRIQV